MADLQSPVRVSRARRVLPVLAVGLTLFGTSVLLLPGLWLLRVPIAVGFGLLAAPRVAAAFLATGNLFELQHVSRHGRLVALGATMLGGATGHALGSGLRMIGVRYPDELALTPVLAWADAWVRSLPPLVGDLLPAVATVVGAVFLPLSLLAHLLPRPPEDAGALRRGARQGRLLGALVLAALVVPGPLLRALGLRPEGTGPLGSDWLDPTWVGAGMLDSGWLHPVHADSLAFTGTVGAWWLAGYAWHRPVRESPDGPLAWRVLGLLGAFLLVLWPLSGSPASTVGGALAAAGLWVVGSRRATSDVDAEFPALFYVLLLVTLAVLGLGGVAFTLDRARAPLLLALLALLALAGWAGTLRHTFAVRPGAPGRAVPLGATLAARVERDALEDVIVVVAHGGGIQAAGWVARVLTGLDVATDGRTSRATVLACGASGGSLGLLHVLDRYQGGQLTGPPDDAVDAACHPSLDDAAWGLAYPDVLRVLLAWPWLPRVLGGLAEDHHDRGWSLEKAWLARMRPGPERGDRTLGAWAEHARDGALPVMVLQATIAESGGRFLFANADVSALGVPALDLAEADVEAVTATRLSATFPYASPLARAAAPITSLASRHLADGGIFDNSAMTTTVQLLDTLVAGTGTLPRLHLVEVVGFPDTASTSAMGDAFAALLGPITALASVRTPGWRERNLGLVDGLRARLLGRAGVEHYRVVFPSGLATPPPLSWQMSHAERRSLDDAWRGALAADREVQRLVEAFRPPNREPEAIATLQDHSPTANEQDG